MSRQMKKHMKMLHARFPLACVSIDSSLMVMPETKGQIHSTYTVYIKTHDKPYVMERGRSLDRTCRDAIKTVEKMYES